MRHWLSSMVQLLLHGILLRTFFLNSVCFDLQESADISYLNVYSLIRRGSFLEISGSNWGACLMGKIYRDRK